MKVTSHWPNTGAPFGAYIGGAWSAVSGDEMLPVIDPAREAVIVEAPAAQASDLDRAVAAAREAFPAFAALPNNARLSGVFRIFSPPTWATLMAGN